MMSSTVKGMPSFQVMPGRSFSDHCVLSQLGVIDSAIQFSILPVP